MSLNLINLNQLSRECNGIGGLLTFNEPLRQIFVAQFLMESLYFSFFERLLNCFSLRSLCMEVEKLA